MNLPQFCSKSLKIAGLVALCAVTLYAANPDKDHGHGRCPHRPEKPSLVLVLLGTAGLAWQYARARTLL